MIILKFCNIMCLITLTLSFATASVDKVWQRPSRLPLLRLISHTMARPLLYTYCKSSCSWRVRIGLNYKEIPYDAKYINIYAGEGDNRKPEYKELINPIGHVPALKIDGHLLLESMNILHYLEETRPQKPLMPKDPYARAQVRVICEMVTTAIQPLQNKSVLEKVGEDKKQEWAAHWIARGFRAIEKLLSGSAGKYCVGDEITLADCCLVPQVYGAWNRFDMDISEFPTIVRIDKLLAEHPAFRSAHAENQPDYP